MKVRLPVILVPVCLALVVWVSVIRSTPGSPVHAPQTSNAAVTMHTAGPDSDVLHSLMIKNTSPEHGPSITRFGLVIRTSGDRPPPPITTPSNWRALPPQYEDSSDTWEMYLEAAPGTAIQAGSSQDPFLARAQKGGLKACELEYSDGSSFRMANCPIEVGQ